MAVASTLLTLGFPHDISLVPMCSNVSFSVLYQGLMIFWRWFPGLATHFWGGDGWKWYLCVRGGKLTLGDDISQSVNSCLAHSGYTQRYAGQIFCLEAEEFGGFKIRDPQTHSKLVHIS